MLKLGGPDLIANHLWGIVLAGRVSDRLPGRRPLARLGRRPTWLPAAARHSLFRQALERASRLIPEERLVAVLARDHSTYYDTELQDLPAVRRIRQPMYRGSAPEVFLPALRIAQEDPHATVVVLPSDQLVEGEARFMNYVGRAAQAVGLRPELPVVIGAHPLSPDPACPWIEPGPPIEGLEAFAVRSVKRFLLRPSPGEVAALYEGDGLVNTQVIIAKARALIDIGRRHLPDVLETLEPLEAAFGAPEEPLLAEALYEQMPYADIAHALFVRPHRVAVLPVADVRMWRREVPAAHALAS